MPMEHSQKENERKTAQEKIKEIMKLDFHIHTNYSRCSRINPKEAVKQAEKEGLDIIALVNHDLNKKFNIKSKVRILRGVEVSTKEGHLLIINTNKQYEKGISAQEAIKQAEKTALIIIAHPYDFMRRGIGQKLDQLKGYHALEINARCLINQFNKKAELKGKPLIAGSDSHFINEIGNAWTEVNAKTINQAINEIKAGRTKVFIKKRTIKEKLHPFIKSMKKQR